MGGSGVAGTPAPAAHIPRREGSPLFLDDGPTPCAASSNGIKRSTFTNLSECFKAPPKNGGQRRKAKDEIITRSLQKHPPFPEPEDSNSTELGAHHDAFQSFERPHGEQEEGF